MSLITDFRKTVRSRMARERPVETATHTDQKLHSAALFSDEPTNADLAANIAGTLKEASGTYEVNDDSRAEHEIEETLIPQVKRKRGRVTIAKSPDAKKQQADNLTPTNMRSAGAMAGSGMLFVTPTTRSSKAAAVLRLLEREGGATLTEIMAATGWQAHSIRGFLSGTIRKKLGQDLISVTDAGGLRRYRIAPNDRGAKPEHPDRPKTVVDNLSPDPSSDKATPIELLVAGAATNEPVA